MDLKSRFRKERCSVPWKERLRSETDAPAKMTSFTIIYFEKEDAGGRKYGREDLERSKSEYYALMGWDAKSGIPTPPTLERLGLKDVAEGLGKKS